MRSGRREPELVGGRGRLGRMSGRDDVWQTIEQFTDTFRRRDDHHQRRAVVACDHRHLRDEELALCQALEGERAERDRYRLSVLVVTGLGRRLGRSGVTKGRDRREISNGKPEAGRVRQAARKA